MKTSIITHRCVRCAIGRNAVALLLAAILIASSSIAFAVPVTYSDVSGPSFDYTNMQEDSTTDVPPLFGAPTLSGNSVSFNSLSFAASSTDGGLDITDGTFTMRVTSNGGDPIASIKIEEFGDYTIGGTTGPTTLAIASSAVFVRIIEVDGAAITPLSISGNLVFSPSGGSWDLDVDGPATAQPWSGTLVLDLDGALAAEGIDGSATSVTYNMNNTLLAISKDGSSSFVKKKVSGGVIITPQVPEPSTLALAAIAGLLGLISFSRRRIAVASR